MKSSADSHADSAEQRKRRLIMKIRKRSVTGILLLVIGILFLLNGIHRNEHTTVQNKSNIICLECIGIG